MGQPIQHDHFAPGDYEAFSRRLDDSVAAFRALLARPGFGEGLATIGAELEVSVIDADARALHCNEAVVAESVDARLTTELARFNLEYNLGHVPLAGRPFAALHRQITSALAEMARATRAHEGRVAMIGILPTLRPDDLAPEAMTPALRYRTLSRALRRLREGSFAIDIEGDDPVHMVRDDITCEGACTSFQVHLRVDPALLPQVFDAAQLASAPLVAVAANSPTFLGRVLWDETRIPLFEQAVDDRPSDGRSSSAPARASLGSGWTTGDAADILADVVAHHAPILPILDDEDPLATVVADEIPLLRELRLHNGTVWRWNRLIYDPHGGGHVRVEFRAMPSGPSARDMAANAAFAIGLTLGLVPDMPAWVERMNFTTAVENMSAAARHGLGATLCWPTDPGAAPTPVSAAELVGRLIAVARSGLVESGVDADEADALLTIIEERAFFGQNGAVWQRRMLQRLEPKLGRAGALAELVQHYIRLSASGEPVHRWPLAAA